MDIISSGLVDKIRFNSPRDRYGESLLALLDASSLSWIAGGKVHIYVTNYAVIVDVFVCIFCRCTINVELKGGEIIKTL